MTKLQPKRYFDIISQLVSCQPFYSIKSLSCSLSFVFCPFLILQGRQGLDICLASRQAGLDTKSFYSGGWGGGCTWAKTRALLDNASHRITRCNVNYASLCQVSQHVCQVTLLVTDSLDLKVQCYAYHWSFFHPEVAQPKLGAIRPWKKSR